MSLQELGLRIPLGHLSGSACESPHPGHKRFTVIHTNGIHQLDVDFCGCRGAPAHYQQLLEVGWWPSTPREPQSAATFSVLKHFHVLNLQGQIPPTDFYRALEQITCGDGLTKPPVSLLMPVNTIVFMTTV